ncbi:hypothetical protein BC830DRAFT_1070609, partial [Chytriomyces sp. MP71]
SVYWNGDFVMLRMGDNIATFDRGVTSIQASSLIYLIDQRTAIKKSNKGKDTPLSYGMKIAANSMYGALGASTSMLSLVHSAASVTALGRWLLSLAVVVARYVGGDVLYGDTDSIFMVATSSYYSHRGTPSLSTTFMRIFHSILNNTPFANIRFEYERQYSRLILVDPKNYFGMYTKYDKSSGASTVAYVLKGIAAKRRDRIMLARTKTTELCQLICKCTADNVVNKVAKFVFETLQYVEQGMCNLQDASLIRKEDGVTYYIYMGLDGFYSTDDIRTLNVNIAGNENDTPDMKVDLSHDMFAKNWATESNMAPSVEWSLAVRYSVLDYQRDKLKCSLSARHKYVGPPEVNGLKAMNTMMVPRLYTPYFGYTDDYHHANGTHSLCTLVLVSSNQSVKLRNIVEHVQRSNYRWVIQGAELISYGHEGDQYDLSVCYSHIPLHAYNLHARLELQKSSAVSSMWYSMYDEPADVKGHAGVYGVIHDNGLIDTRPYDSDALAHDSTAECDPSRRINYDYYSGFIDVTYTPMSLEAGRIRSLVHGCKYRVLTNSVLDKCKLLIDCLPPSNHPVYPSARTKTWRLHMCGSWIVIDEHTAMSMMSMYTTFRGHDTPSLHVFAQYRILSIAFSPGCIMKPCISTHGLYSGEVPDADTVWIDSLHLLEPSTHPSAFLSAMRNELRSQCLRTYTLLVPFAEYNEPPRCIMASNMAVQAICRPRTVASSTMRPVNAYFPVVRTALMQRVVDHEMNCNRNFLPGVPLTVLFANMDYNYEDAVIMSTEVNSLRLFARESYVYHPVGFKHELPELGKTVPESATWWRPYDPSVPVGHAYTTTGDRAVLAEIVTDDIAIGDKVATQHGQKFTVSKILTKSEMPHCICNTTGERIYPHIIIASSSCTNRVTPGQIWEAWVGRSAVGASTCNFSVPIPHTVLDIDAAPGDITPWTCQVQFRGSLSTATSNSITADYGIIQVMALHHVRSDKQQYASEIPTTTGTIRGKMKGAGVRVGEMETHALLSLGMPHCLNELTMAGDLVTVSICSKCRRLTLLCDCDGTYEAVEITTRMIAVKADIQMAIYRLNGDPKYNAELRRRSPQLYGQSSESSPDLVGKSHGSFATEASSFKYY